MVRIRKLNMTKSKLPQLSLNQFETLIAISLRNSLDVVGKETPNGYQFLILLDCLAPEDCIPHDEIPEGEEEIHEILDAHGITELSDFLSNILGMRRDDVPVRAVETVAINSKNVGEFLEILDGMCNYWDSILEDDEPNVAGKNVVEGNDTVN
jgi:hypothetical protein